MCPFVCVELSFWTFPQLLNTLHDSLFMLAFVLHGLICNRAQICKAKSFNYNELRLHLLTSTALVLIVDNK